MCTVDTDVFGLLWENQTDPHNFIDFNTAHVCKNFDAVREWAQHNQIPDKVPIDYIAGPGEAKIYQSSP
jgi:hypothetical protein